MAHHRIPAAEEILDTQFPVLDHGFVILVDYMGGDAAIAEAARQSLAGENTRPVSDDRALIRYLMSNLHTSPFEMVEFKFHCAMPIFVARQWVRHRTASLNEQSGRYGEMPELVYVPKAERIALQSTTNKQGSGAQVSAETAQAVCDAFEASAEGAFSDYHELLGQVVVDPVLGTAESEAAEELRVKGGISRELARIILPLTTYTQWYWKIDLHNLLHFLFLRLDAHAQWEIRQYAKVMVEMVKAVCPIAWEAFVDYRQKAVRLSLPEQEALHVLIEQFHHGAPSSLPYAQVGGRMRLNKREVEDFRCKLVALGFGFLNGF